MLSELWDTLEALRNRRETMIGFPLNLLPLPLCGTLRQFLDFPINNLGDPFVGGAYGLNTFAQERGVVHWFADLWGLSRERAWGYVTNSGSEGNLQGILAGRERLGNPVLYASDKAHYSVWKAARMLRIPSREIETDDQHRIDLEHLWASIDRQRPALLCLTAGTTMAGAVDDIPSAVQVARAMTTHLYVHVDAALGGLLLPFLSPKDGRFFEHGIDSASVSGHKQPGVPIPCGVFVSRHQPAATPVEYLGSRDATIGGSRSGWAALALWTTLHHHGVDGFDRMARQCLERAVEAEALLDSIGWPHWRAPLSITVMLARPCEAICRRWQLAVEGEWAHLICVPHVTGAMLETFTKELQSSTQKEEGPCCVS